MSLVHASDAHPASLARGPDAYRISAFSVVQLEARLRAVLRRSAADSSIMPIVVGGIQIHVEARVATLDGGALQLSPKEFDLLVFLANRVGVVVSRRQIMAEVWRQPYGGSEKTVDVHISWLRKKLGETAAQSRYIETVHGVGIKLVDPT